MINTRDLKRLEGEPGLQKPEVLLPLSCPVGMLALSVPRRRREAKRCSLAPRCAPGLDGDGPFMAHASPPGLGRSAS